MEHETSSINYVKSDLEEIVGSIQSKNTEKETKDVFNRVYLLNGEIGQIERIQRDFRTNEHRNSNFVLFYLVNQVANLKSRLFWMTVIAVNSFLKNLEWHHGCNVLVASLCHSDVVQ
jgi:uncharacterized protein YcbK (DUF882 family)